MSESGRRMMICLVMVLVLTFGSVGNGGEFKSDGSTTLLCHFNGNLDDVAGNVEVKFVGESPVFVPGKFDKGISLGKTHLVVESRDVFNQKEGTVEMWVKPHWDDTEEPDKYNNQIRFFDSHPYWLDCVERPIRVRWFSDGGVGVPPGSYLSTDDITWSSDEWRYLAATWKDNGEKQGILELYMNGELMLKSDNATIPNPGQTIRICQRQEADSTLEVIFDEMRISNVRRTADEIKAVYEMGKDNKN